MHSVHHLIKGRRRPKDNTMNNLNEATAIYLEIEEAKCTTDSQYDQLEWTRESTVRIVSLSSDILRIIEKLEDGFYDIPKEAFWKSYKVDQDDLQHMRKIVELMK